MNPVAKCSKNRSAQQVGAVAATALLAGIACLTLPTSPVFSQAVVVVNVDVQEVAKGYRASELTGAAVENKTGEEIGKIDDLVVDRQKVLFAVLQVGGFLGIGGRFVAVPYNALELNEDGSKIVLAQGSKEELQKMPEFKYLD